MQNPKAFSGLSPLQKCQTHSKPISAKREPRSLYSFSLLRALAHYNSQNSLPAQNAISKPSSTPKLPDSQVQIKPSPYLRWLDFSSGFFNGLLKMYNSLIVSQGCSHLPFHLSSIGHAFSQSSNRISTPCCSPDAMHLHSSGLEAIILSV